MPGFLFQTPPLPIIDAPADAAHTGPKRFGSPQYIIIHATAGTDSLEWLRRASKPPVSIHRLIKKDGKNYKVVPDDHIAYHAGYSRVGVKSNLNDQLSIELENLNNGKDLYPDTQVDMCAAQVLEWWSLYGLLPILSHAQVDTRGKTDPKGFPWPRFYGFLLRRLHSALGEPTISEDIRKHLVDARTSIDSALLGLLSD